MGKELAQGKVHGLEQQVLALPALPTLQCAAPCCCLRCLVSLALGAAGCPCG